MDKLQVDGKNRGLLSVIYLNFFTNGMLATMLGVLLPFIKEESGLTYAQSGLVLSAHQVGNLCAVLAAGVLPYLMGRKTSSLLTGSGIVLGFLLMTVTRNPLLLVVAFAFTGIFRGTMSNLCNSVVAAVSGNKTGALNILHAAFAVGALLSPVIIALFTQALGWGWRGAAVTIACLGGVALVLLSRSSLTGERAVKEGRSAMAFLRSRLFWMVTGILFFYLCAEASIIGWFVIYFEDIGILPSAVARFTPTLLWLMIMAGRLGCAALSGRVDRNNLMLALGLGFAVCFGGLLLGKTAAVCIVFLLGIGLTMAGIYPTTFACLRDCSTMETGFCIALASFGAILMPGIVGAVADIRGLFGGVAMILAALVCMVLLMLIKLVGDKKAAASKV